MYQNEPGVYELFKADSGALRFKVRYPLGMGFAVFTLTSKENPTKDLYQVFFGPSYRFVDASKSGEIGTRRFHLPEAIGEEFRSFWLTWHTGVICLGMGDQNEPILYYADPKIKTNNIGFIKFFVKSVRWPVEWEFEASPVSLKSPKDIKFQDGELRWVTLANNPLPVDALIAGFENEPLYIARAMINNSLCPGKYTLSSRRGYLPWGGEAHPYERVQILTGYNAKWVKTRGNYVPENAFVAGYSEVMREPLYIGRAMYDNHLLVGKVHCLYKTCYLPYKGKEVELDCAAHTKRAMKHEWLSVFKLAGRPPDQEVAFQVIKICRQVWNSAKKV